MKKAQLAVAGVLSLVMAGIIGIVVYLAFIFPKTLAVYEQEARALSLVQRLLANTSSFCKSYMFFLLQVLLVCFVAALVWLLVSTRKGKTDSQV